MEYSKQKIQFVRTSQKMKTDKGGAFISKRHKKCCKSRYNESEYSTLRLHTGIGAVERAILTIKNSITANLENNLGLIESVNRALNVMRFKKHTGLKKKRKPRSELTALIKDGKSFLSKWSELSVSSESRSKIPTYVSRNSDGEVSNHIVMVRTKAEENAMTEKSPKKKSSVCESPFKLFEKNHDKKMNKRRIPK